MLGVYIAILPNSSKQGNPTTVPLDPLYNRQEDVPEKQLPQPFVSGALSPAHLRIEKSYVSCSMPRSAL